MVFSRRPKSNMGWGELFAARLLEGFVISQQRPAATQARHRKPALIV